MGVKQDIQDFFYTKDWYANATAEIRSLYGRDWRRFVLILAATSPRQGVKANWTKAKRAFKRYKAFGVMASYSDFMLAHRKNLEKIRDTPDMALGWDILSGQKVQSFAANLLGNLDKVTIDMWMVQYFGIDKLTKKTYDKVEKRVQILAKRWGLCPAELQAILWSAERARAGYRPATYLIASIDDHQLQFEFMV